MTSTTPAIFTTGMKGKIATADAAIVPPATAINTAPRGPMPMATISVVRFVRQGRKKFWHAESPTTDGSFSLQRKRGPTIVAVRDDRKKDYRLKLWTTIQIDTSPANRQFSINGQDVTLAHVGGGRYQGAVSTQVLDALHISGPPPPKRAHKSSRSRQSETLARFDAYGFVEPGGVFADVCWEAGFTPGQQSWQKWTGSVEGLPKWMGHGATLTITPPETGGGWHCLDLRLQDAPAQEMLNRALMHHRVNGEWVHFTPVSEADSSGNAVFRGRFMGCCDPGDLHTIRDFVPTAAAAPNEPMVPRTRLAIRALDRFLAGGGGGRRLPFDEERAWIKDIETLRNTTIGLAAGQGQLDVNRSLAKRRWETVQAKQQSLKRLVARAAPQSEIDTKRNEVEEVSKMAKHYEAIADDLDIKITFQLKTREEVLTAIEAREAQYTSEIARLFPAPPVQ